MALFPVEIIGYSEKVFPKNGIFPNKKMKQKVSEADILQWLQSRKNLLSPIVITSCEIHVARGMKDVDALIGATIPESDVIIRFCVEVKSSGSFGAVLLARHRVESTRQEGELPLIVVPYLAPDRLEFLETNHASGIDLCGNGVIVVPNRLWVIRTGNPNRYPDSRPLNNPYRGRSAMVARVLLKTSSQPSLTQLVRNIASEGEHLSIAQASKAVNALEDDYMVWKIGGVINLRDSDRLLDKLGDAWRTPAFRLRKSYRVKESPEKWAGRMAAHETLRWAVTGESSASRYLMLQQGGPRQIAVSNLEHAEALLNAKTEPVHHFADLELVETKEPGYYFQTEVDENKVRWASRLQTWLELQAGDPRQRDASNDLRMQLLGRTKHER